MAYDQVGSLRAVADSSGNVVKEITYDSFGYILDDTNPDLEIPIGFAGGLHDRDTGLVRFGYRDYDPETGRWTAKDPILFAGGDTDLYGYAQNHPIGFVDPYGLKLSDIAPGIKKAIVQGVKGAVYSTGEAAKDIHYIAREGHPLAQTALGIAFVSEAAPLAGAAGIAVTPSVVSASYAAAPYSPIIVDAAYGFFNPGPPPQTPAGYGAWAARRILFGPSQKLFLDTLCK